AMKLIGGSQMSDGINWSRRRFVGTTATTFAAQLGVLRSTHAGRGSTTAARATAITPATSSSFDPLKQIDAGLLNVGYADVGPSNGPAVVLLHGWPYDIHSFVDVAPRLASSGYDHPDHVSIVVHNYRWRLDLVEGEAKYDDLEKRLAEAPVIAVPTITL